MRLQIDVVGEGEQADTRSLMEWLRTEPELVGRIVLVSASPVPGDPGPAATALTVSVGSGGTIAVLAAALIAYLRARRGITMRITNDTGQTVVLGSEITVGDAGLLLKPLVESEVNTAVGDVTHRFISPGYDGRSRLWQAQLPIYESYPLRTRGLEGSILLVTIYLSEEGIHEQVEAAVDDLLATAGLGIEDRDEPVIGSWFRTMRAAAKNVIRSPVAREGALIAAHAADTRLVLAQDAAVTATLMQNLGPVIASLQPTKDAVLRVGALLIVKVNWVVSVFQLTAAQQAVLDHRPQLASSPREIIAVLDLTAASGDGIPPAVQ